MYQELGEEDTEQTQHVLTSALQSRAKQAEMDVNTFFSEG